MRKFYERIKNYEGGYQPKVFICRVLGRKFSQLGRKGNRKIDRVFSTTLEWKQSKY